MPWSGCVPYAYAAIWRRKRFYIPLMYDIYKCTALLMIRQTEGFSGVSISLFALPRHRNGSFENATPTLFGILSSRSRRLYLRGNSANTLVKILFAIPRFTTLILSLSKWALSLAWPHGSCAAGALNSFSKNRITGIDPPSRM